MADTFTLTCPSCGGKLRITSDIKRFLCVHCGNEHIVRRGDGTISLQPIVEGLTSIQKGTDKTASELAIKRLQEELVALNSAKVMLIGEIGYVRAAMAHSIERKRLRRFGGTAALIALGLSCIFLALIPSYQRDQANPTVALTFVSCCVASLVGWGVLVLIMSSLGQLPNVSPMSTLQALEAQKQEEIQSINMRISRATRELAQHQGIVSIPE